MYKLYFSQKIPIDLPQAWDFFSSPANLQKITPQNLAFKIKHHHESKKMYAGQIISYTIRPVLNWEMEWVTEITAVNEPHYFIDEQKFGPYAFWHHEHWFTAIRNGVLIEDVIYYKVPFGFIGRMVHSLKIKKDLDKIFSYRNKVLEERFGTYQEQ